MKHFWLLSFFIIFACSSTADTDLESLAELEPEPVENQLLPYPSDGATVQVNPPGFTWPRHAQASAYRFILYRSSDTSTPLLSQEGLSSSVALLDSTLSPGDYAWTVLYLDDNGSAFGRSRLRNFSVSDQAPQLLMPSVEELNRKLSQVRPRLYLTPEREELIRDAIANERVLLWDDFQTLLEEALEEPLYPEPDPYDPDKEFTPEWRRIYTPAKTGTSHMVRFALAFRLTGEERYLEKARQWLLHFASWDPRGIASHDVPQANGTEGNDEASMPILERSAIVYDWIYDHLSPEEKVRIEESMTERGNQVLEVLKEQDFLSNPFSNHEGRVLAFLGLAGLSFLGEIPEAAEWLDYVLQCYLTSYPVWGGDDGGWAQGLNYWSAYLLWLTEFSDALRTVTDVDLYKKPFFRNTGYLAVYFHPPYAPRGAFGDGGEVPPNLTEKLLLLKLAGATRDPVLLWHSQQIETVTNNFPERQRWNEWFMEDIHAILHVAPEDLQARPPLDLPDSKLLDSIGWAAAHTALGNPEDDVWLLFKSSRFGSFSHSHADQNSFQLNAYGRPLLIDSGYYPSYGSPHHLLWTRQTRAHNAVLVNGRGQGVGPMASRGEITHYETKGKITVIQGEAAEAYNTPHQTSVLEAWKEHLSEPIPAETPRVVSARRSIAFVGEPDAPWIVIHDSIETEEPALFQYLLHSEERMSVNPETGLIQVVTEGARLTMYLVSDVNLQYQQQERFPIPPGGRLEGEPEQFHLTAETAQESRHVKFMAILVPHRPGQEPLEVRQIREEDLLGFEAGPKGRVLAWWSEEASGTLVNDREGRLLIEVDDQSESVVVP